MRALLLVLNASGCADSEPAVETANASGSVDGNAGVGPLPSDAVPDRSALSPSSSTPDRTEVPMSPSANGGTGAASPDDEVDSGAEPNPFDGHGGASMDAPSVPMTEGDAGSADDEVSEEPPNEDPTDGGLSTSTIDELAEYLGIDRAERPELEGEPFANEPLSAEDAELAAELLWQDLASSIAEERQGEVDDQLIMLDGFTLRYETVRLGDEPEEGRSLFLSMHGGGSAPAETNDEQWRNQVALAESYAPEDALWIAPRAPTDDWNMWFKDHIDPLFDRLITNLIVFEGVDPNRVYLTGYSAGGDGVYQLGPRMADRWAAAAMSAGHPNDASPVNLRNIGFAIHVGGDDTAFSRNEVALEWGALLDQLQQEDPDGYEHQVEVHPGLPHWMNLADRVSIPFVQSFQRNPAPDRVVWRQTAVTSDRFYWLSVSAAEKLAGTEIVATRSGQAIEVEATGVRELTLRLSDALLDMDSLVTISVNGQPRFEGIVPRTIAVIHRTLVEREDPAMVYRGEVALSVP